MISIQVTIRLRPDEHAKLVEMSARSNTDTENGGDFWRMLLHREWNRRKGLPKPKPSDYQGAYRIGGRPRKPRISTGTTPVA